ncbi:MAG TPA: hypothetical protein VGI59_07895 [Candidatus Udaeobacter sp.]
MAKPERFFFLGSARGSRAGERVLAIANFSVAFNPPDVAMYKGRLFRRDAETSARVACAPQRSQRQRTVYL